MATVTITGGTGDAGALGDNRPWKLWAALYQSDGDGGVITTRDDREANLLRPVAGVLTFEAEAGIAAYIETPDKRRYLVSIPEANASLWSVIEAAVAVPPETSQAQLTAAVAQSVIDNADNLTFDGVEVAGEDGDLVQFMRGGQPVGSPVALPSATWGALLGRPVIVGGGATKAAARAAIDAEVVGASKSMDDITDAGATGKASARSVTQLAGREAIAVHKLRAELDLREWVSEADLPNDLGSDCSALFSGIVDDLSALYTSKGLIHVLKVPAGKYRFDDWTIPPRSGIGVRGEGMYTTTFQTATFSSFMGRAYQVGDPDFIHEDMIFEDFTVDGSRMPDGASYNSSLKAFVIQNARNVWFRRVRAMNTHATGFGVDYSDLIFFRDCVSDNCGRGRKAHTADPQNRTGSGSGFGIGFGLHANEHVEMIGCHSKNNGASGFFEERLGNKEVDYHSTGMVVLGGVSEGNATGINGTGANASRFVGVTLRDNLYAGLRVGLSIAFEPGSRNGMASNLAIYGNAHGVVFEGNAGQTFNVHDSDIRDNIGHGVWLRDGTNIGHGRGLRFHDNHIHGNGGAGVLGSSALPIPEFALSGNHIHDNGQDAGATYRDEVCFTSPMGRATIKGNRIRSRHGYAIAFRGAAVTVEPQIEGNDLTGSAGGAMLLEHTIADTAGIVDNKTDQSATVTQLVGRPVPDAGLGLSGWSGSGTTRTRQAGGPTVEGVAVGSYVQGVATSDTPIVWAPAVTVTPGTMVVASIYARGPKESATGYPALNRPAVRFNGTDQVTGPMVLASGDFERLDMLVQVPAGATTMQVGARGSLWTVGDVLDATCANVTDGVQLWPYIDGTQPHCAWTGTAFNSTSTLTIPSSTAIPEPDGIPAPNAVVAGEATFPRDSINSSTVTSGSSGTGRFSYFTAEKTETVSAIRTISGTTALPADVTLAKVGVHEVDPATGNLTLVAVTANEEATLWAAASTAYTTNFVAPFNKVRGKRYAVEFLWVGPTTGPTYTGQSVLASELAAAPRLAASKSGQTDIVAGTITSVSDIGYRVYAVLLP